MTFAPSSLTPTIVGKSNDPTVHALTTPNSLPQDDTDAATSTVPSAGNTTNPDATVTSTPITAGTIRKVDDITPSPMCNYSFAHASLLDPEKVMIPSATGEHLFSYDNTTRVQDPPPKQARDSTSSRATKYFICDLTSVDPPKIKAFYPIFNFRETNKSKPTLSGKNETQLTSLKDPKAMDDTDINSLKNANPMTNTSIVDLSIPTTKKDAIQLKTSKGDNTNPSSHQDNIPSAQTGKNPPSSTIILHYQSKPLQLDRCRSSSS
jgi:hypothetical protein